MAGNKVILYLQKLVVGHIRPMGSSLLTPIGRPVLFSKVAFRHMGIYT